MIGRMMMNLKQAVLNKLNLVTREEHKRELNEVDSTYNHIIRSRDAEIENMKKALDPLIRNLTDIQIYPPDLRGRYRLSIEFAEELVYRSFIHGNSQQEIRWIAERMGYELEKELRSINFTRVGEIYDRRAGI